MSKLGRVLIIEDSDTKWQDVATCLEAVYAKRLELSRASTIKEANELVSGSIWNLILLDISMNIRPSSAGQGAGGHDTVGGLKVAERMFYLGHEAPVIIVTAFDAFPAQEQSRNAVLGLEDVIRRASSILGENLRGWIRYGDQDWKTKLISQVASVVGV